MNYLTEDGYIFDQLHTGSIPYGKYTSDWTGCGWIAVYNILRFLGKSPDAGKISAEMSALIPFGGKRGTPVRVMRSYLRKQGVDTFLVCWKTPSLNACMKADCAIIRFFDVDYPHYVAMIKCDGKCRFFNADGGENHISTADEFFSQKISRRFVRAIIIK